MSTIPKPWVRTTRSDPCPVCRRRAGCLLSSPGDPSAVICRSVPSDRPIGAIGFLHELTPRQRGQRGDEALHG